MRVSENRTVWIAMNPKKLLNEGQKRVLEAFADTLIPPSEKIPYKPSDLKIADKIEALNLACSSRQVTFLFRWVLNYLQYRASFFRFCGKTFTRMDEKLRGDYLASFYDSPLLYRRMLFRFIEANVVPNYYACPEVARCMAYQVKLPNKTPSSVLYGEQVRLDLDQDKYLEADVCIIGSGAGGAPVAASLAQAGFKVVILEEGGRFDLTDFKGDAVERTIKMYRDFGLTATLGTPLIPILTGKTLGGTTTINSGTCFRTPDSVLEKWRNQYGLNDLTSEEMAPYFEKVEKAIHVVDVPEELLDPSAKIFRRGLEKMGLHGIPLKRNVKECEGSSLCCFGCPTDAKQSVQLNYIPQALRAGAEIYPYTLAQKIIHQGGRATEVIAHRIHPRTQKPCASIRVKAKIVVVAGGTLQSPLLLRHSGIGTRSKALGNNLTLHPAGKALALFEDQVLGWRGVPQSFYCPDYKDRGIMFEGAFMPPSIQSLALLVRGKAHKEVMDRFDQVATFGFLISDESRGRVRYTPKGDRLIFYSLNQNDFKKFVDAIQILCRVFFEAGARKVYPPIHNLPVLHSSADLDQINIHNLKKKDLELLSFHPLGTCCMGVDPQSSVVDSHGKVHGMENVFVSDGGIFPSSLGVNPQISIMAFATRTAEYIKRTY